MDPFDSAVALVIHLRSGGRVPPMVPTIGLEQQEQQLAGVPLMVGVHNQADATSEQLPFFAWGDATIVAASVLAAYSFRQSERQRVAALNRPQWRIVDYGTLHITSHRLAIQGSLAWQDIPYSLIRMFEQHEDGVVVHLADRAPGKLIVEGPEYLFVLLNFVAFGRVVDPVRQSSPMSAPAGWYQDPTRRHRARYWDGTDWTDYVADDTKRTQIDPLKRP